MRLITDAGLFTTDSDGARYVEHLSVPDMSIGTYSLEAGAVDGQQPHTEDEIYVVTGGRAKFTGGGETVDVTTGSSSTYRRTRSTASTTSSRT